MKSKKITDKNINFENYATFIGCEILNSGRALKFTMSCGDSYQIPIKYFFKWFDKPHHIKIKNELLPWDSQQQKEKEDITIALQCEKILDGGAVRVLFSNNAVYDVSWDTVLMACDRRYEYFGGLTETSKNIIETWFKDNKNKIIVTKNEKNAS